MILNAVVSFIKSGTFRAYRRKVVGKARKEVRRLLRTPKRV